MMMRRYTFLAFGALAWSACAGESEAPYYPPPGDAWETRTPAEVGMDATLVEQAVEYARTHDSEVVPYDYSGHEEKFGKLEGPLPDERGGPAGIILRHGYIVAEWGDTQRADLSFSVTKSFVSTMAGLAFDRGMIGSTQDPIGKYVTDGKFDSPHNAQITWEILLQQSSEWEGILFGKSDTADFYHRRGRELPRQAPGTYYEYNDERPGHGSHRSVGQLDVARVRHVQRGDRRANHQLGCRRWTLGRRSLDQRPGHGTVRVSLSAPRHVGR
jgi:hypothetical protein